jgi:hypothetical protein
MSAAPQIRTALMENLKALHLPAMRECFEQAAQQAEKETLSYEQYLLELSERECESRRRNRIAALLRESGLPREKTMANFDLKRLPVLIAIQAPVEDRSLARQGAIVAGRRESNAPPGCMKRSSLSAQRLLSADRGQSLTDLIKEHMSGSYGEQIICEAPLQILKRSEI